MPGSCFKRSSNPHVVLDVGGLTNISHFKRHLMTKVCLASLDDWQVSYDTGDSVDITKYLCQLGECAASPSQSFTTVEHLADHVIDSHMRVRGHRQLNHVGGIYWGDGLPQDYDPVDESEPDEQDDLLDMGIFMSNANDEDQSLAAMFNDRIMYDEYDEYDDEQKADDMDDDHDDDLDVDEDQDPPHPADMNDALLQPLDSDSSLYEKLELLSFSLAHGFSHAAYKDFRRLRMITRSAANLTFPKDMKNPIQQCLEKI
jgi:hypothetical protein